MSSLLLFFLLQAHAETLAPWPRVDTDRTPVRPSLRSLSDPRGRTSLGDREDRLNFSIPPTTRTTFSGDNEIARPDGDNGGWNWGSGAQPAASDSIEIGTQTRPGPRGTTLVGVNGCTDKPGRFQLVYDAPPRTCDPTLIMEENFAEFISANLSRCAQTAAKSGPIRQPATIWHAGVAGDSNHTGRSYHNLYKAIDLKKMMVNGKTYTACDPADAPFFAELRKCWGEALNSSRGGCLAGTDNGRGHPPGTIGAEDPDHRCHVHLSHAFCPDQRASLGMYTAFYSLFAGDFAFAQNSKNDRPQTKIEKKSIQVKNGQVEVTVKNTGGEPVDADTYITAKLVCKNPKQSKLATEIQACAFDDVKYDQKLGQITIHYRTSIMLKSGVLGSREQHRAQFQVKCD